MQPPAVPDSAAALPSLLTSRPREHARPKPICLATEPPPLPRALPETYEQYPMYVPVRNTFIDTGAVRSPSLERFYREREVNTCPSSKIGLLKGLFQEEEEPAGCFPEVGSAAGARPHADGIGSQIEGQMLQDSFRSGQRFPHGCPQSARPTAMPNDLPAVVWSLASALEEAGAQEPANGDQISTLPAVPPFAPAVSMPPALAPQDSAPAVTTPYVVLEEDDADTPWLAVRDMFLGGLSGSQPGVKGDCSQELGPGDVASVGSVGHSAGHCKPCAFFHTVGCSNGLTCKFCHLCEAGERKRRRKQKLEVRRAAHQLRKTGRVL